MFSSRPGSTDTLTGPIRLKASITSSTKTSGAEAPAVMPTAFASFSQSGFELAAIGNEITRDADLGADFAKPV